MKQILLAAAIILVVTSCGNSTNENNSGASDTTGIITLLPATDTMPATDTNINRNRMTDTMQMKNSKDRMIKKKDSANKKAKK